MKMPWIIATAILLLLVTTIGLQRTIHRQQNKRQNAKAYITQPNKVNISNAPINVVNTNKMNTNRIPANKEHASKANINRASTNKIHTSKVNIDHTYDEYNKAHQNDAINRDIFRRQLISNLDNLKRVEIILPKDGPELGRYLVDMDPDETLTVGTISTNSNDFDSLKKEIRNMLEPADKKMMASSALYNTWLRLIFDDDTSVLAMFSIKEYDFFIFDNKKKGSSDEPDRKSVV
jgi:hypothetical protein